MTKTKHPAAHLPTVRRLEREHARAMRREESADDLALSWRLAAASDRVLRRLAAARDGLTIEAPRTARNRALGAFVALATIGRVIARATVRAASLARASVAAAAKRAALKVAKVAAAAARASFRRVVSAVVALVASAPAAALAHPGHPGGDGAHLTGPESVVLVGITLGLAAHAWATWGKRRPVLATVNGVPVPVEPEPEPERTEADHDAEVADLAYEADRRESEAVAALHAESDASDAARVEGVRS